MTTFTGGMTPSEYYDALNNLSANLPSYFNIEDYGAIGNDSTDNTTAIQDCIDACLADGGGTVFVPPGTFKTHTIATYPKVKMLGLVGSSILKSISAEPLINLLNDDAVYCEGFEGIELVGDSIGTIGLNLKKLIGFKFKNISIREFTTCGAYLSGCLIGHFDNCYFTYDVIGVWGVLNSDSGSWNSNLVTFKNCGFYHNTTMGAKFTTALMTAFRDCDFEHNGTNGNSNTGCIYVQSGQIYTGQYGRLLQIDNSWFEANYGTLVSIIDGNNGNGGQLSTIADSMFIINTNATAAVKITGVGSNNHLILRGSGLMDAGAGVTLSGAKTMVINQQSDIVGSITITSDAIYKNHLPHSLEEDDYTVSGARDNPEGALADLITKLVAQGIIIDGTTET